MTPNDRGYGQLAVCGSIRCRTATKWMRERNLLNGRQPANDHRRVLGVRSFLFYSRLNVGCLSVNILENIFFAVEPSFQLENEPILSNINFFSFSRCRNAKIQSKRRNFKICLVNILSTSRSIFSLFWVVRESFIFFFLFVLSKWVFRPKAWKVSKSKSCFKVDRPQFH